MRPIVTDQLGRSVCHTSEPCKNGCTDRDAVWVEDSGGPKEPCIRWGSRSPMGRGNFEGKGRLIVKYRDTLQSSVQKRLNWSRCRLGYGLRRKEACVIWGSRNADGRCHGNQFWNAICYNWLCGCMIARASDPLFGSRAGFSGSSYPMKT